MPKFFPTGAHLSPEDKRDIKFASIHPIGVSGPLPRQFSLRPFMSDIFLQKYGECVGGSARYTLEFYKRKDNINVPTPPLSDRFLYGRAKELDGMPNVEGTWPRIMLKVMFGLGAPLFDRWPHEPSPTHADFIAAPPLDVREEAVVNRLNGGFARVMNYAELKEAIFHYGPVMVTLNVYDTYDGVNSTGHIKPSSGAGFRGGHENIAIGWNDDTQEIELMNQWGTGWGDAGFAFMPRTYQPNTSDNPFTEMWVPMELINAATTAGAPILGYPVETNTPFITQRFGERPEYYAKYGMKGHNGIDFRTIDLVNHYIIAADDGKVVLAANDGGYGLAIRIQHSWGMSIYGHNSKLLVSDTAPDGSATFVKKGQRIAIPGSTGDAQGEHCHFGIRINGVKNPGFFDWVDPMPYFGKDPMTNAFFFRQGNTFGIGNPSTNPDAIISQALNSGLQVPFKAGVPDTAPAGERIDWAALDAKSYKVQTAPGLDELPDTTGIPDEHKV